MNPDPPCENTESGICQRHADATVVVHIRGTVGGTMNICAKHLLTIMINNGMPISQASDIISKIIRNNTNRIVADILKPPQERTGQ